jgi:hypothetical protein
MLCLPVFVSFSEDRWKEIWRNVKKQQGDVNQARNYAVEVLRSSGFYDDPNDATRTLSNMETAAMVYARETLPYVKAGRYG